MMHGIGMSFGLLCLVIPVALAVIGVPLLRRLFAGNSPADRLDRQSPVAPESVIDATLFRLAQRFNGRLTVSDVVVETGLRPQDAEQALQSTADGLRVLMDVQSDGSVVYDFVELHGSNRLSSAQDAPGTTARDE
jgi:hypothetical protein